MNIVPREVILIVEDYLPLKHKFRYLASLGFYDELQQHIASRNEYTLRLLGKALPPNELMLFCSDKLLVQIAFCMHENDKGQLVHYLRCTKRDELKQVLYARVYTRIWHRQNRSLLNSLQSIDSHLTLIARRKYKEVHDLPISNKSKSELQYIDEFVQNAN